jgi:outer membrane biosynthesis protein TonB
MKLNKRDIKGLAGTLIFHLVLLLCFLFFGFTTPLPLPEEEGVEVNLGYSNDGSGDIQPVTPNMQDGNPSQASNNFNLTQNAEETASLNDKESKNKNENDNINKEALYKGKKNPGGNEGETGKPGDQGNPNGDPNAKNHYGNPGPGNSISFSLSDRKSKSLPKPNYYLRDEGIVVVTIWVDKQGNVTKAIAGARGTTTSSQALWKLATDAAMRSKFDAKNNAPEEQKGTITYNFVNLN